ncbi:MAG: hypothetical protein J6J31_12535 [Thermoguttaceae bacterium]|nr:hypothetical protein [Thermoguttaceae bacterium]
MSEKISMSFDQAPFSVAMAEISSVTGVPIVWGQEADKTYISGIYEEVDVNSLLLAIGKRYGLGLSNLDGVYFMGTPSQSDFVSIVVRSPFADPQLMPAVQSCLSENGKIAVFGSCYVISDYVYNVRKVVGVIDSLREKMGRSYIAELFFIRCKSSELLNLQAKLETEAVDLFSCSWNLEELFSALLSVEGTRQVRMIQNTPRLYLSEGRQATLTVGSELVRSRSSVSSEGYSTVSGYEKFNDGIEVSLTPSRIGDSLISLDVDLSVSKFDSDSLSDVPKNDKSSIVSPGVLVTDGGVYFLGSLQMQEQSRGSNFFGVNSVDSDELITVWVKIREVFLQKCTNST